MQKRKENYSFVRGDGQTAGWPDNQCIGYVQTPVAERQNAELSTSFAAAATYTIAIDREAFKRTPWMSKIFTLQSCSIRLEIGN